MLNGTGNRLKMALRFYALPPAQRGDDSPNSSNALSMISIVVLSEKILLRLTLIFGFGKTIEISERGEKRFLLYYISWR